MQRERYAAIVAVLLTVAVSSVEERVGILAVERDETKTVGNEFICENRGILFDFDKVDCYSGDFSEDDAPKRVCEG